METMEEKNIKETHTPETDCCGHDHEDHHHEGHHHDHEDHGHHHDEECCGHDHHHHDHEDHDHEGHEHHHHHDDDCCGHDHHHDHDHNHDHEGHDHHHHDHGHQYDVPGFRIFETHSHEGATICSFEKDIAGGADTVVKQMENCINTLEKWLDETDAAIGHVKGYVKESGPVTTFSTVGCGLNIEKHEGASLTVGFAGIVFGPAEEGLKDKVAEVFAGLGK